MRHLRHNPPLMDSIQSAPGGGSAFIFDFSWLLIVGSPLIVAAVVAVVYPGGGGGGSVGIGT